MARISLFFLCLGLALLVIAQTQDCSWAGHCLGARCNNDNDCSDDLVCGIFCPTHGCGGGPKQCMRPSYGKRRRRDVVDILAQRLNKEEKSY